MEQSYGFPLNFASKQAHIAITCCVNFGARKFTKFMAKYQPVFD
jgi:hypothetical protein